jgi:hypothetical protein
MGVTKFNQVQADQFLGSQADASPFGKIWYVDGTNGADGNIGDEPGEAFSTIAAAISAAVATRGDTVVIYPGTYTITAALVAKANMTFKAAVVVPQFPTVSIAGNIAELVTVDVSGTRWIGLEFLGTGYTCVELVDIADGAAVNGATFEDCRFRTSRGSAQGLVMDDGTNAATGVVVRRCLFQNESACQLEIGILGAPMAKIEDNTFVLRCASSTGIAMADTSAATQAAAAGHGYVIRNNDFIGQLSLADVGITILGTEDKNATGIIRSNFFGNCAVAAITANQSPKNMVRNYVGDSGTGGTIVDAGN